MTRLLRAFARPSCAPRPARNRRRKLAVENLEDRTTPTTFTVRNTNDSGTDSLRDAIAASVAAAGTDVIDFDPTVFNTPRTISLLTALPTITLAGGDLTITGPGANLLTVRRDLSVASGTLFRLFNSTATNLTMSGMTVTGARNNADGGALQAGASAGTVILNGMVFTDNQTTTDGGAVGVVSGTFLQVSNSTISGNLAGAKGGGIYHFGNGSLLLENSTLSGNRAASTVGGGALYLFSNPSATPPAGFTPNTFLVRNSTISGNTASAGAGGGILWTSGSATGNLVIQNSTLTGNTAQTTGGGIGMTSTAGGALKLENSTVVGNTANGVGGGGVARLSTTVNTLTLSNSIVSNNTNATRPDITVGATGTTIAANFSAIGNTTGLTITGANNLAPGTNLQLGTLGNYGGTTRTLSPAAGSPLINAGSDALIPVGITTDQRGGAFARSVGGAVDIGAVESQAPFIPVASGSGATQFDAGGTSYTFTVVYSDPTGTVNEIDTTSVINNHTAVRVIAPDGTVLPATFVSIDDPAVGSPRTVTYSITPPGGSWDRPDTGTYTIEVVAGQVFDTEGTPVQAGPIGTFQALILNLTVLNDADSGFGSLRQTIGDSMLDPGPNTITFDPSFFNTQRNINLQTALPQFTAGGGPVTITGPGAALLNVRRDPALPAGTTFRLFDSLAPSLTMTNFTVSGARSTVDGGALQAGATGTTVTLDGMVFSDNQVSSNNDGGAIRINGGAFLTLRNSTLSGNTAAKAGGAIYFFSGGSLLMENSTISGNTASSTGSNYGGGGLYFWGTASTTPPAGFVPGSLVIRNSTIANNTAASSGGGVLLINLTGNLLVQNSTIVGNTANNTAAGQGGGGIARTTGAGSITATNSIVSGNTNANGADILSTGTVTSTSARSAAPPDSR